MRDDSKEYIRKLLSKILGIDTDKIKHLSRVYYYKVKDWIDKIRNQGENRLSEKHREDLNKIYQNIKKEESVVAILKNFHDNFYDYLVSKLIASFSNIEILYKNEKISVNFLDDMLKDNLNDIINALGEIYLVEERDGKDD